MNDAVTLNAPVAAARAGRPIARYLRTGGRALLGLTFVVCGLNGFLDFLPHPTEPVPAAAVAFGGALMQTGYMFPLIKGTEVVAGALLLTNRLAPFGLVLLAPVLVNILAFHAFLARSGLGLALALTLTASLLAWSYRDVFRPLFARRDG